MPTFSGLPNELVAITSGFVDEPEDIQSFALVSKKVYWLSIPFLQEHARLRKLLPTIIIDIEDDPSGPHVLLERLLHYPRLAFYIHEAHIEDWRAPLSRQNVSLASLSPERMAAFEGAVRRSSYIPPSEKDAWVRKIKKGNPDPIVALIMMRLTKLRNLRLVYPYTGGNAFLHKTLKRMTFAPDRATNLGSSVTQIGSDSGSHVSFKRPSPFRNIKDIEINLGGIKMNVVCKMLQGMKSLKGFSFTSSSDNIVDVRRLKMELLGCSRDSLHKLILHDDCSRQPDLGLLNAFEKLKELNINLSYLRDGQKGHNRRLIQVLPTSIEKLSLYMGNEAEPDDVEEIVDQVIECKINHCPKLHTFIVETMDLVELYEEEENPLENKLAEVGVRFDLGEYSNL